jgi:hypothetical protein
MVIAYLRFGTAQTGGSQRGTQDPLQLIALAGQSQQEPRFQQAAPDDDPHQPIFQHLWRHRGLNGVFHGK